MLAAQAAGVGVQEFVDANAAAFTGLAEPLNLSVDDLIRTSSDPRHRAGVERLWQACAASGDLYRRHYEGLYCVGCEQFYTDGGAGRRALPRPRHGAGAGVGGELVLPPVPLRRPAARPHRRRRDPHRAGRAPQRGPGAHRRRPGGLLRLPQHRARPRLGHPGPRRPGPGHLRVVGRARQLPHGTGLRRRRREPQPLVDRRVAAHPPARQGRAPVPRRLLARDAAVRRGGRAHRHRRPRLPHRERPQDQQVQRRHRRPVRPRRQVRHGRGALVAAARGAPGRGRRLHRRPPRQPRQRRARQRPRQPRQPGRHA